MKIMQRKILDLIPSEYNPRHLTSEQTEHLEASLKRFGAVDPAIINIHPERKNIIIGGHQRLKVAQKLGWQTFPCVELELDKEKEKELNIRLNKNTGEWYYENLANFFEQQELVDWGFGEQEVMFFESEDDLSFDDLIDDEKKNNPAQMKITFKSVEDLQKAEIDIQEILDRKYKGAYFSVNAGEF